MLNSVHESGSRTMPKNRLRNSTKSKLGQNRMSAPSAQPADPATRPDHQAGRASRACCLCPLLPARQPLRPTPRPSAPDAGACAPSPAPARRVAVSRPSAACLRPRAPAHAYASPCAQPMLKWAVAHFKFYTFFFFSSFPVASLLLHT